MSAGKQYTNSWAVQVTGGEEIAKELARKHGFDFMGKVCLFFVGRKGSNSWGPAIAVQSLSKVLFL